MQALNDAAQLGSPQLAEEAQNLLATLDTGDHVGAFGGEPEVSISPLAWDAQKGVGTLNGIIQLLGQPLCGKGLPVLIINTDC